MKIRQSMLDIHVDLQTLSPRNPTACNPEVITRNIGACKKAALSTVQAGSDAAIMSI